MCGEREGDTRLRRDEMCVRELVEVNAVSDSPAVLQAKYVFCFSGDRLWTP